LDTYNETRDKIKQEGNEIARQEAEAAASEAY